MASQIDICNLALTHISKKKISSLDETESEEARRLQVIWHPTRLSVLREYPWNFAMRIEELSKLANESTYGWLFAYQYPSDCVRALKLMGPGIKNQQPYRVLQTSQGNSKMIASNIDGAHLEYTANVLDPMLFDPLFVEALAYKLAATLAVVLTENGSLAKNMLGMYASTIEAARVADANEQFQGTTISQSNPYIDCR